ncbi:hypothetical protein K9U40_11500 [Xanthobacter autotrophicus]|uniref:hypothetical protein n=1 Tax=Xanthobacter TaxID=279 RepID=UPI0024ABCEA3|nr:hypothetical protein [Xanthobacter autotrophicus]MDI4664949.1 hypothetical protein [Xanthobacter autotrophicus]
MTDNPVSKSEERALLRKLIFQSVNELADLPLQRRTWLNPPTPSPHWSYVEFCCSYPDLDQLTFDRDHNIISADEFEALIPLCDAIIAHDPPGSRPCDHVAILNDPAWHEVITLAERVRQRLIVLVSAPEERQCLLDRA